GDGASQQREGGEGDGAHGQLSSWSSWCLSCSWPGRRSRMSPLNVSSSSRPLPDPSVKLKRCLVVFVTLTGKLESKSPLKVATDTVTLVRSGIPAVTAPCAPSTSMSVETPWRFRFIQAGAEIWYSTICANPRRLSAFTLTVEAPTWTSIWSRLECVACTRMEFWFQALTTISPPKL